MYLNYFHDLPLIFVNNYTIHSRMNKKLYVTMKKQKDYQSEAVEHSYEPQRKKDVVGLTLMIVCFVMLVIALVYGISRILLFS